ncbi:MAG TPA: carboxypeptidase-like regulatory domain-containing protein [Terriglobia bacterium]|nr:carboxypeptidase-like regulatory domain-containing protein [Terriglobia bacterium]
MRETRTFRRTGIIAFILTLVLASAARAQVHVEGRVMNGTSNRPVANAEVLLLTPKPQVGMQLITKVTADANGHFAISDSSLDPATFYLVQVNAGDVPYHFPIQPGTASNATVDATVYDAATFGAGLHVSLLRIMAQASGDKAQVQQEYRVENDSRPPRTYSDAAGTFRFRLPPEVTQPSISVAGLMNMQIPQTPTPGKSPGEFVLHYPFKPGVTAVTVRYEGDYTSSGTSLNGGVPYPVDRAELYVMPANLEVKSALFKPAGRDDSNNIENLIAEKLPGDSALTATLSGDAVLSQQPQDQQQGESQVKVVPDPMTKLGVPLLACFLLVLLWALGICASKEWQHLKTRSRLGRERQQFESQAEELFNSIADLDELFEAQKIEKNQYWKERLELKAKLTAILKKGPASLLESYATRRVSP